MIITSTREVSAANLGTDSIMIGMGQMCGTDMADVLSLQNLLTNTNGANKTSLGAMQRTLTKDTRFLGTLGSDTMLRHTGTSTFVAGVRGSSHNDIRNPRAIITLEDRGGIILGHLSRDRAKCHVNLRKGRSDVREHRSLVFQLIRELSRMHDRIRV